MALADYNLAERTSPLLSQVGRVLGSPYTWVALATGILLAANSALTGPGLSQSLGDTDDAVRLLTVRELLAGAPLLDTTLARIGAPDALVSHWSRLIDLPLAAMILLLRPFAGAEAAEWLTRAVWPILLFAALALLVAREAKRQAGSWAPGIALALISMSAIAMVQFRPGRIDHHNAQILCAVAGLLLLRRCVEDARAGWLAGLFLGLGLAVGYESIALVVPMLAGAAVLALCVPTLARGPVHALTSASATMLAALLATTAPGRLTHIACDALSLNLVVLAACGAAGLWIVSVLRPPLMTRFAIAGVAAGTGAVLYAGLEPACLAGPFGQVDPALKPIWLDHVLETQSLFAFTAKHPSAGVAQFVLLAAGLMAQALLLHRERTVATALATATTLLAIILGLWQIKLMPYATWLSVVPIAVLAAKLRANPATTSYALRGLTGLLLLMTFSDTLVQPFLPAQDQAAAAQDNQLQGICYQTANVEKLATLAPGLIAADIDLGPYIAALTPHRVVAAPYHRLDRGILALNTIFKGDPEVARTTMASLGVRYIATCSGNGASTSVAANATSGQAVSPVAGKGLRGRLLAAQPLPWIEEIDPGVQGMRVWRVLN